MAVQILASRLKGMGNKRYVNGFALTVHPDLIDVPVKRKKPELHPEILGWDLDEVVCEERPGNTSIK